MSQKESIEQALKEAERFETEKFYAKVKFRFRSPNRLKDGEDIRHHNRTEIERINQKILNESKLDNSTFDKPKMVKPDVHRKEKKEKWLTKEGF